MLCYCCFFSVCISSLIFFFFFQAEDGIRDFHVTGVQTCALPILRSWGAVRTAVRENRAFLGRAVRYLVSEAGIRQFLDIGTGLPSANNVHEVAQAVAP